ncbi:MAG: DUF1996 domain-containing protein [Pseudonocardiaceae bacterium]
MARGKHRIATPARLIAAAAVVLTAGGIVIATGTASADNAKSTSRVTGLGDQVTCRVGQVMVLSDMLAKLRGEQLTAPPAAEGNQPGNQLGRGAESSGLLSCADNEDDDNKNNNGDDNGGEANNDTGGGDDKNGDNDDGKGNDDEGDDGKSDNGGGNNGKGNDGGGNGDGGGSGGDDNGDNGGSADEDFPGRDQAGGPFADDFVDIQQVSPNVAEPEPGDNASTGSFTSVCGTNEEGHLNSDNFMVAPGKVNGAQHVHDYVGNLSTDAFSNDESLDAADTTCAKGDKSTYFWPVIRDTNGQGDDANADGGGLDGNVGEILQPASVDLTFRGSPEGEVTEMPKGLAIIMGDAKAVTNGNANAKAAWTCSGFEDRTTEKYPLCPQGSNLMRVLDFPSCWDGQNLDSANHRDHIVFPQEDGSCDGGTVAVPQLRMTLTYDRPDGDAFAMDTFPEQQHDPSTDHADFMNMMPEALMEEVVDCINTGQNC